MEERRVVSDIDDTYHQGERLRTKMILPTINQNLRKKKM